MSERHFSRGKADFLKGIKLHHCPYVTETASSEWGRGWFEEFTLQRGRRLEEGKQAYYDGRMPSENPYNGEHWFDWNAGWLWTSEHNLPAAPQIRPWDFDILGRIEPTVEPEKAWMKHKGRAVLRAKEAWDAFEAIYVRCGEPSDVSEMVA